MAINKIILLSKKVWLWAKKFWWAIVLVAFLVIAGLISIVMRNGAIFKRAMDLLEAKRDQHDQEMETLSHIHNTEVAEKNIRLEDHLKEKENLKEVFEEGSDRLDKTKEAELKKLIDEGYNDPETLAKQIADTFGLKDG
jgi:flagellar biosynthesis/type III secretory pathway M-ring protein FliF/YscJ